MAPVIPFLIAAAPYIAAAGAVVSAYGAIQAADAKATQNRNIAAAMQTNANIASRNANQASDAAGANEQISLSKSRAQVGEQIAGLGGSGVDTASGSPASSIGQSVQNGTMNALMISYNGLMQRQSYLDQSGADLTQAGQYRANASQDETAGVIGAGASLLGGASTYANNAAKIKAAGTGAAAVA